MSTPQQSPAPAATPTLNNLLRKPSMVGQTAQQTPPFVEPSVYPQPSSQPFPSPQPSPVANGSQKRPSSEKGSRPASRERFTTSKQPQAGGGQQEAAASPWGGNGGSPASQPARHSPVSPASTNAYDQQQAGPSDGQNNGRPPPSPQVAGQQQQQRMPFAQPGGAYPQPPNPVQPGYPHPPYGYQDPQQGGQQQPMYSAGGGMPPQGYWPPPQRPPYGGQPPPQPPQQHQQQQQHAYYQQSQQQQQQQYPHYPPPQRPVDPNVAPRMVAPTPATNGPPSVSEQPQSWAKINGPKDASSLPSTPGVAASPGGASSVAGGDEGVDDKSTLSSPSWPHTPAQHSQGQRTPVPPSATTPSQPGTMPPSSSKPHALPKDASVIDKLVGLPSTMNPAEVLPQRRAFFENLCAFLEREGEPLTAAPTVSKQVIDLHRLYIAVRRRGGFEQVTKEKTWKNLCPEANPEMAESSAAGYQLRRHYQKYLLNLECSETGQSANDLIAFAEKQKKSKKKKAPEQADTSFSSPGAGGQPSTPAQMQPGAPPSYGHEQQAPYYGHYPHGPPGHPQHDPSQMGHHRPPPPHQWPPGYGPPQPPSHHAGVMPPYGAGPMVVRMPQQPSQQQPMMRPPIPPQSVGPPPPQPSAPSQGELIARDPFDDRNGQAPAGPQPSMAPPSGAPGSASAPGYYPQQQPAGYGPAQQMGYSHPQPSAHPSSSQAGDSSAATPTTARVPNAPSPPVRGPPQQQQQQPPSHPNADNRQPDSGKGGEHSRSPSTGAPGTPQTNPPQQSAPYGYGQPGVPPSQQQPNAMYPSPRMAVKNPYQQQQQGYPGYAGPGYHPEQATQSQHYQGGYATGQPGYQQQPNMWQQRPVYNPAVVQRMGTPDMQQHPAYAQNQRQPAQRPPFYPPSHQQPNSPQRMRMPMAPMNAQQSSQPSPQQALVNQQQRQLHEQRLREQHQQQYQQMQQTAPQFPPGSVEAAAPTQRKRRKIYGRDIPKVEPWRLVMALKSGLDAECHWALNALNILLYDDASVAYFGLSNLPGLLEMVVEHLRCCLVELFPDSFDSVDADPNSAHSSATAADDDVKPTLIRTPIVTPESAASPKVPDFTKLTRTGRAVSTVAAQMPLTLERHAQAGSLPCPTFAVTVKRDVWERGLGTSANYLRMKRWSLIEETNMVRFRKHVGNTSNDPNNNGKSKHLLDGAVDSKAKRRRLDSGADDDDACDSTAAAPFYFRKTEQSEESAMLTDESRSTRPKALSERSDWKQTQIRRCLALSNILRGLSFLSGNEAAMAKHPGLLYLIGRCLLLGHDHVAYKRVSRAQSLDSPDGDVSDKKDTPLEAIVDVDDGDDRLQLVEAAIQLREDAFVVVCHLSVQLDLINHDEMVVRPLLDGLVHWSVCPCAEAGDALSPGPVSPRNYALEALCKLSVVERNVDLLLGTGPWPRLERFIQVLAKLLSLGEEVPYREFAVVLMNALCAASQAACVVAALDTPAVHHLVAFLEMGDSNMHQVVQQHGMQALRDNPEMMGTSVGMLRRAASVLQLLSKVPACRCKFAKHQQRLLQFTMSQLMDSRVAAIIADTLYELQKDAEERREKAASLCAISLIDAPREIETTSVAEEAKNTASATNDTNDTDATNAIKEKEEGSKEEPMDGVDCPVKEEVAEVAEEKSIVKDASPPPTTASKDDSNASKDDSNCPKDDSNCPKDDSNTSKEDPAVPDENESTDDQPANKHSPIAAMDDAPIAQKAKRNSVLKVEPPPPKENGEPVTAAAS